MHPVLAIQAGAGGASEAERTAQIDASLIAIADAVFAALVAGQSAVDAAVDAVRRLEDDPLFNAGTGSKLQIDGGARMSAALMDGATERFSGVVNIEGIANPIVLSRHLLDDGDRVLMGHGALARADELGLERKDVRTPYSIARFERGLAGKTGTVGAAVLDVQGNLAAATSTGGRGLERVGRVSDSCMPAGNFATPACAVSATGIGEQIIDHGLCVRLCAAVEAGQTLADASAALEERLRSRGHDAGFVAVDATGAWSARFSTAVMHWHVRSPEGQWSS